MGLLKKWMFLVGILRKFVTISLVVGWCHWKEAEGCCTWRMAGVGNLWLKCLALAFCLARKPLGRQRGRGWGAMPQQGSDLSWLPHCLRRHTSILQIEIVYDFGILPKTIANPWSMVSVTAGKQEKPKGTVRGKGVFSWGRGGTRWRTKCLLGEGKSYWELGVSWEDRTVSVRLRAGKLAR